MRIVSGHQPVYLPWLGLIHKASLADVFIFMDDVQYLTQDWNNRNCIKTPQGKTMWLTVPVDLKKSCSKNLKDIVIAEENVPENKSWQIKHWNSLRMSYAKSPYFNEYKSFFEWLYLENKWHKLSELNLAILKQIFLWFDITTDMVVASELSFKEKKSDLILEHGRFYNADVVITGAHGKEYIDVKKFDEHGIKVICQEYRHPIYKQRFGDFIFNLSFVDLLFNHGPSSREICLRDNISREDIWKDVSN